MEISMLADISVLKTAAPSPVDSGASLTYSITVSNAGPSPAANTILTDEIPSELNNVEFSTDGGVTFLPWSGSYLLGTLAAKDSPIILIRGTTSTLATGGIRNTAVVSSNTSDPDPNNNTSAISTPVPSSADLTIVKMANPSPVFAGNILTYTLLVSNEGTSTTVNVNLTDMLPDELVNPEISTNGGSTWLSFNSIAFLENLEPEAFIQILIRSAVATLAAGILTNTATVDSGHRIRTQIITLLQLLHL